MRVRCDTELSSSDAVLGSYYDKKGMPYVLEEKDSNPAEHYQKLADGCKVANGVAVLALATFISTVLAVASLKVGAESDSVETKKDDDARPYAQLEADDTSQPMA